jgi:hypothetical protein
VKLGGDCSQNDPINLYLDLNYLEYIADIVSGIEAVTAVVLSPNKGKE